MRFLKLLLAVLCLSVCVLAAGESPFSGTWKMNIEKSHGTPPAPKSSVAQINADEENFKLNQELVDNKDQKETVTFEATFDGKDYPVNGAPDIDSVSIHRVNQRQIRLTYKKAGKIVLRGVATVSKDGKVTTFTYTDYSQAKPQKGLSIYEKQ